MYLQKIEQAIDNAESTLINLVAKCAPWLAPLPSAWLVYAKSMAILKFPHLVGLVAGLVIEALGLASVSTALTLREYNASKRKSDPSAPFALALVLAMVYFVSVISLTIVLELVPEAATYALVIFPFLSLTGATCLALRADHRRRLASIESVKQERKTKRQTVHKVSKVSSNDFENFTLDDFEQLLDVKRDAKEWAVLRELVYIRDGKRCQKCNVDLSNDMYHCHHIKLVFRGGKGKPSNLITLCQRCHEQLHSIPPGSFDTAHLTRRKRKQQRLDNLATFLDSNPGAGATEAARAIGVSRQTAYNYAAELGHVFGENGSNQ